MSVDAIDVGIAICVAGGPAGGSLVCVFWAVGDPVCVWGSVGDAVWFEPPAAMAPALPTGIGWGEAVSADDVVIVSDPPPGAAFAAVDAVLGTPDDIANDADGSPASD